MLLTDTLWITADSSFRVYANGRHIGGGANARKTHKFPLPGLKAHLIAVHAMASSKTSESTTGDPGILASLQAPAAPSGVSSSMWRCTHKLSNNDRKSGAWTAISYDDKSWLPAAVVGEHGESPWGTLLEISQHADWIWAYGKHSTPKQAFCRGWMSSSMCESDEHMMPLWKAFLSCYCLRQCCVMSS